MTDDTTKKIANKIWSEIMDLWRTADNYDTEPSSYGGPANCFAFLCRAVYSAAERISLFCELLGADCHETDNILEACPGYSRADAYKAEAEARKRKEAGDGE